MQREIDFLPFRIREPGRQERFKPAREFRGIVGAGLRSLRLLQRFGCEQIGFAPIVVAEARIGIRSQQETKNASRTVTGASVIIPSCPLSDQLKPQFAADQGGGALEGFDGDVALGLEDAIHLGAAGVHLFGERGLGHALTFHFLGELPGNHARDRFGLRDFADAVFAQEHVERCAPMGIFLLMSASPSFLGITSIYYRNSVVSSKTHPGKAVEAGSVFLTVLIVSRRMA
jgi:hypothetical protein